MSLSRPLSHLVLTIFLAGLAGCSAGLQLSSSTNRAAENEQPPVAQGTGEPSVPVENQLPPSGSSPAGPKNGGKTNTGGDTSTDGGGNPGANQPDPPFPQDTTPPDAVTGISLVVGNSDYSEFPLLSWSGGNDSESGLSHFEIRIVAANASTVVGWKSGASGLSLAAETLIPGKEYAADIRAVDNAGNIGPETRSAPWLHQSLGCFGPLLTNAPYAEGDGSPAAPFVICTEAQLRALAAETSSSRASFRLASDIDLSSAAFNGIGSAAQPFMGRFLGNGKAVKNMTHALGQTLSLGFFNSMLAAYVENLTIESPVVLSSAIETAALAGTCQYSSLSDVRIFNAQVSGDDRVGIGFGMSTHCGMRKSSISGNVSGSDYVGGGVGYSNATFLYDLTASVSVNATGSMVGGLVGADGWVTHIQDVNLTATVTGSDTVGGIIGGIYDGLHMSRTSATVTVTGNNYVGGAAGSIDDSPVNVRSTELFVNVTGQISVGGAVGETNISTSWMDVSVRGSVNEASTTADNLGGFAGHASADSLTINRAFSAVSVGGTSATAGGIIGRRSSSAPSSSANNTFFAGTVTGAAAGNTVSSFVGDNSGSALAGAEQYYLSGTCTNTGGGGCNTTEGTAVADVTSFYSKLTAPLSFWNFDTIWEEQASDFPRLRRLATTPPAITGGPCPSQAAYGVTYTCNLTVTDPDPDENWSVFVSGDHTCGWLRPRTSAGATFNRIEGNPQAGMPASCVASIFATDGKTTSPLFQVSISIGPGITVSPGSLVGVDIFFDFGEQAVAGGVKPQIFTITNDTSETITGMSVTGLSFPFALTAAYPGTNGNCGTNLTAGNSCQIEIGFNPSLILTSWATANFNFTDSGGAKKSTVRIKGKGT